MWLEVLNGLRAWREHKEKGRKPADLHVLPLSFLIDTDVLSHSCSCCHASPAWQVCILQSSTQENSSTLNLLIVSRVLVMAIRKVANVTTVQRESSYLPKHSSQAAMRQGVKYSRKQNPNTILLQYCNLLEKSFPEHL